MQVLGVMLSTICTDAAYLDCKPRSLCQHQDIMDGVQRDADPRSLKEMAMIGAYRYPLSARRKLNVLELGLQIGRAQR